MFNLGSRSLLVTSALAFIASAVYASNSTDRLGLAVLFAVGVLSAVLAGAGVVGTGAADRFVFVGDIDPARSVAVAPSIAPIMGALAAGCLVGGAALGAPLYAAGGVVALLAGIAWFIGAGRENPTYVPAVAKRVSDGITVPFGLPVAAAGLIAVIAISVSRTLLAVNKTASWIVVLVFAAAVFFGGLLIASRPKISRRTMVLAIAVTVVAVGAMGAIGLAHGERKIEHHHGEAASAEASK